LAGTRGYGDNVLHGAGEFYPENVVVGVEAETWSGKLFLDQGGE
jgi:hypothetical protein